MYYLTWIRESRHVTSTSAILVWCRRCCYCMNVHPRVYYFFLHFSNSGMKGKKNSFSIYLNAKLKEIRSKIKRTINILFYLFKHCCSCQILIVRHLSTQNIKFLNIEILYYFLGTTGRNNPILYKFMANIRMKSFLKVSVISIPDAL